MSLRLGKQRHQFPRLPVEILSVQTVPIIHSVPSVTTQVHVFCHLRSGDLSFLLCFFFFYCSGGKFCLLHLILSVLMFNPKTFWSEYLHDVTVKKSCLAGLFLCLCFMFLCFRIDYISHMFISGSRNIARGGPVSDFVGSIISVLNESPGGAFMPNQFGSVK